MNLLEKVAEFNQWPREIQEACVYQLRNTTPKTANGSVGPKRQKNRNHHKWSDEDRLQLFGLFEEYGWDKDLASSWAKKFGRTANCLRAQFDKEYSRWDGRTQ